MKRKFITLIIVAGARLGVSGVFTGESHWWKSGRFDELEVVGGQQLAIETALQKCHNTGTQSCTLLSSQLTKTYTYNGYKHLEYQAIAKGYSVEQLSAYSFEQSISKLGSIFNDSVLNGISLDAVEYLSFMNSLNECYQSGCDLCIPESTTFREINNFRQGAYWSTAESLTSCYRAGSQTGGVQ